MLQENLYYNIRQFLNQYKITFVSPGYNITAQQQQNLIEIFPGYFECYPSSIHDTFPNNMLSLEDRIKQFQAALDDDSEIIWCMRGGYGSIHLLRHLKKPKKAKVLIGYSDITVLHLLFRTWGFITIHGAVFFEVLNQHKDPKNFLQLIEILKNHKIHYQYAVQPINGYHQKVIGNLFAGNLSVLCSMIGTKYMLNLDKMILFLEDIDEQPYRIDRYLQQLYYALNLNKLGAVIFGDFIKCNAYNVIADFTKALQIPTFMSTGIIGHDNHNHPLLLSHNIRHCINDGLLQKL